jgi:hypothetical protein
LAHRSLWLIDHDVAASAEWLPDSAISTVMNALGAQGPVAVAVFGEDVHLVSAYDDADPGTSISVGIRTAAVETGAGGDQTLISATMGPGESRSVSGPPVKDLYGAIEWAIEESEDFSGATSVVLFAHGYQPGLPRQFGFPGGLRAIAEDDDLEDLLEDLESDRSPRFMFVGMDTDLNPGAALRALSLLWAEPLFRSGLSPRLRDVLAADFLDRPGVRMRQELLANSSGRALALPVSSAEYAGHFEGFFGERNASYVLGYEMSSGSPGERTIRVRVRDDGYSVRQSRESYVVP